MSKVKILFRVDADGRIGTGNLYECIWFSRNIDAESLFCIKEYGKIQEVIDYFNLPVSMIGKNEQGSAGERAALNRVIDSFKPNLVVFDMPYIKQSYLDRIKLSNAKTVALNAVFNPIKADAHVATVFSPIDANKQFFGTEYILLRNSSVFEKAGDPKREVSNILILFGGADPCNLTIKALESLTVISKKINVTIVLGWAYKFADEVNGFLKNFNKPFRLFSNIKGQDELFKLMSNSDMAIASGAYTLSELMRLGVPAIALSQTWMEENKIFNIFPQDAFVNLGRGTKVSVSRLKSSVEDLMEDFPRRKAISEKSKSVVDGRGSERLYNIIKNLT